MKKILIIDDEKSIRNTFRVFLEKEKYCVVTSEDAEQACAHINNCKFDLIITDCIMPKISGLEFLTTLRTNNDLTPVIIMTGEPIKANEILALDMKASAYLPKPVSKEVLLNAVRCIFK